MKAHGAQLSLNDKQYRQFGSASTGAHILSSKAMRKPRQRWAGCSLAAPQHRCRR